MILYTKCLEILDTSQFHDTTCFVHGDYAHHGSTSADTCHNMELWNHRITARVFTKALPASTSAMLLAFSGHDDVT